MQTSVPTRSNVKSAPLPQPRPSLWFRAIRLVQLVPRAADALIDDLAQSIDRTERLVFRACMPGRERQVLAELELLRTVEFLLGDVDGRNLVERSILLGPLRPRVFDVELVRSARLDHEVHARVTRRQGVAHRFPQKVRTWIAWHRVY